MWKYNSKRKTSAIANYTTFYISREIRPFSLMWQQHLSIQSSLHPSLSAFAFALSVCPGAALACQSCCLPPLPLLAFQQPPCATSTHLPLTQSKKESPFPNFRPSPYLARLSLFRLHTTPHIRDGTMVGWGDPLESRNPVA